MAGDMKIVSMQRTDGEKQAAKERATSLPSDGPDYSWGLCLNLGKEELAKLGVDELPEVGDEFHIYAVATVTRVSQSASKDGEDSKGVELQITHMGAMHEDEADGGKDFASQAKRLYGSAEDAEGESGD